MWWQAPVIPATWRLREENRLNTGGRGHNEPITPLHSTLATEQDSISKKKMLGLGRKLCNTKGLTINSLEHKEESLEIKKLIDENSNA